MVESPLLKVSGLQVHFLKDADPVKAVDGISFDLQKGECLGIVGESGSGKSVTGLSILNLLSENAQAHIRGKIEFHVQGNEFSLLEIEKERIQSIRGHRISMIFQEPMSTFNPVRKCGSQVREILEVHKIGMKANRRQMILDQFEKVALPDVERIYNSYPHELSGGQLQRISIAMALITRPQLVICDEPTTALDVTIQKEILELLSKLKHEEELTMIFVSHDLDLVAQLCDHVIVMNNGKIIERGTTSKVFVHPIENYTKGLLACKPTLQLKEYVLPTVDTILSDSYKKELRPQSVISDEVILKVEKITIHFPLRREGVFQKRKYLTAVKDVSINLKKRQAFGIVGESGSGKSTIAKCIAGILPFNEGQIWYKGMPVNQWSYKRDAALRKAIQMVFQDAYGSLNPAMTVGKAIEEAIVHHKLAKRGEEVRKRVVHLLEQVGLDEGFCNRLPHELSGGQRQRICIARALAVEPQVLICDESVSALDVSVQAQILNLLDRLRFELGLTLIFISHDLSVVHYLCDEIMVLKDGQLIEQGTAHQIIHNPQAAYTQELVGSIPS